MRGHPVDGVSPLVCVVSSLFFFFFCSLMTECDLRVALLLQCHERRGCVQNGCKPLVP